MTTSTTSRRAAARLTILDAMQDSALFGPWFIPEAPWQAWRGFLAALFGLPPSLPEGLQPLLQEAARSDPA